MSHSEAQQFLKENEVKYILAQFVDIHGSAKTKSVPAENYKTVVTDGAGFAGFAIWGMGMRRVVLPLLSPTDIKKPRAMI